MTLGRSLYYLKTKQSHRTKRVTCILDVALALTQFFLRTLLPAPCFSTLPWVQEQPPPSSLLELGDEVVTVHSFLIPDQPVHKASTPEFSPTRPSRWSQELANLLMAQRRCGCVQSFPCSRPSHTLTAQKPLWSLH